MRRLIVTENITVDGVISPIGDWFDPGDQDEELAAVTRAHGEQSDALVLGRVTYEEFAGYWPGQIDVDTTGVSAYLNQVAKYVVSSTLERAEWVNTTILRGPVEQELLALKNQDGADITVTGSATLAPAILAAGLADVIRLFVFPLVQGHGARLFQNGAAAGLEPALVRRFGNGVVLLEYAIRP